MSRLTDADIVRLERAISASIAADRVQVPPFPAIVVKLQTVLASADASTNKIAATIQSDPVLSAEVLRAANSALYRSDQAISSLQQAVVRLGGRVIMEIACAVTFNKLAGKSGPLEPLRAGLWRDALVTAHLAARLGHLRRLDVGELFIAGLLHNFSAVVGISHIEGLLNAAQPELMLSAEEWSVLAGRFVSDLAALVSSKWSLPALVTDIMLHPLDPLRTDIGHREAAKVVTSAALMADLLGRSPSPALDELVKTSALSPDEAQALYEIIPAIAEAVIAVTDMRPAAAPKKPVAQRITLKPTKLTGSSYPCALKALRQVKGSEPVAYEVDLVLMDGLVLHGPTALKEHSLNRFIIEGGEEPLDVFVNVLMTVADGKTFRVEVAPFGLKGAARNGWYALFQKARELHEATSKSVTGPAPR
ncbi:MAG: HDOD domain-containing protein [Deltaproteobacteria bacterium]|nr:HDOD domain-containing protein [Deltaproteobacteria bacterium]